MTARALLLAAVGLSAPLTLEANDSSATFLPDRVQRIVLHTLGSPALERPERRFVFLSPPETRQLWKAHFGTHWILWTDGTLCPRHPEPGEPSCRALSVDAGADTVTRARLAVEAAPVYAHVQGNNQDSVGIELAHSGRSSDPFPALQVRALAWLVETLLDMSRGRLDGRAVSGHKDLDLRPAYVDERCAEPGCAYFVDAAGVPYRRRVDPPEALFAALAGTGLRIPRPAGDNDRELRRAESVPAHVVPGTAQ